MSWLLLELEGDEPSETPELLARWQIRVTAASVWVGGARSVELVTGGATQADSWLGGASAAVVPG